MHNSNSRPGPPAHPTPLPAACPPSRPPQRHALDGLLPLARHDTLHARRDSHQASAPPAPPSGGLRPVPPLAFATVGYRLATNSPPPPLAAFALLTPDAARVRAFHPVRHTRRLVGMLRDAVARCAYAAGWPDHKIASFVLGHAEPPGHAHQPVTSPRLAYLPLPSFQFLPDSGTASLGAARRVLLTSLQPAAHRDLAWLRRALAGCELINPHSGCPEAILSPLPRSDRVLRTYVPSLPTADWATVTPLILPGHDDRNPEKTDALLRKAILQAGFPPTLARHAQIEWSLTAFWPGADLATRYAVPDYLRSFPRFHVRILWRDPQNRPLSLRGPICLGGGRFLGLGLFAAFTSSAHDPSQPPAEP